MADEPENILLQYMRRFDERQERMSVDIHEGRLTHVEENQTIVHRRLDRIEDRLDRIEKRLELVDSPYGGMRES
jgi:hypothetical protein